MFFNIELTQKYYLLLLPILLLLLYFYYKKIFRFSSFSALKDVYHIFKVKNSLFYLEIVILWIILTLFTIILANPNKVNVSDSSKKKWIDIVFLLDISKSMESQDLKPSRIEAAKSILYKFVGNLKTDRVGMVVFAWVPFTSIPLTFDYNVVKETIKSISTDKINQNNPEMNWTAIWDAILMWVNLFKPGLWIKKQDYEKRQKIMILLTDGDANKWVNPILAAKLAKSKWIKIYTIWIGSKSWWYIKYNNWFFVQTIRIPPLKAETLKQIASLTNWSFFRATDNDTFEKIFNMLKGLTKQNIKVKVKKDYKPYYQVFDYLLLFFMWVFIYLRFRRI